VIPAADVVVAIAVIAAAIVNVAAVAESDETIFALAAPAAVDC
jgi:hypothetical protein